MTTFLATSTATVSEFISETSPKGGGAFDLDPVIIERWGLNVQTQVESKKLRATVDYRNH